MQYQGQSSPLILHPIHLWSIVYDTALCEDPSVIQPVLLNLQVGSISIYYCQTTRMLVYKSFISPFRESYYCLNLSSATNHFFLTERAWHCSSFYLPEAHVHIVPNVLPQSLCGWPRTSWHLLGKRHNHPIVRLACLCRMIGDIHV